MGVSVNLTEKIKGSSGYVFTLFVKYISAIILGLTMAMIGEEIIGFQTLGFFFSLTVVALGFVYKARSWSLGKTLIFDLICVLVGLLLRMYILMAPGA